MFVKLFVLHLLFFVCFALVILVFGSSPKTEKNQLLFSKLRPMILLCCSKSQKLSKLFFLCDSVLDINSDKKILFVRN